MEELVKEGAPSIVKKEYPLVEEMTFKGIIKNEQEGYALLRAVQIFVNEFGTDSIIQIMGVLEKKPQLIKKAKTYLPYINML